MMYSCGGLVEASSPVSTRPGWVRQVSGVDVGISVAGRDVSVDIGVGVDVRIGRIWLGVGIGTSDDEQAVMNVSSASSCVIHFVA